MTPKSPAYPISSNTNTVSQGAWLSASLNRLSSNCFMSRYLIFWFFCMLQDARSLLYLRTAKIGTWSERPQLRVDIFNIRWGWKHNGKRFTSFPAELPHPLRFKSKKGANLCSVSLDPKRNREIGEWWATFRSERTILKRTPQFSVGISEKWPYHLPSIRNFRNFLSNGKHPWRLLKVERRTWSESERWRHLVKIYVYTWACIYKWTLAPERVKT